MTPQGRKTIERLLAFYHGSQITRKARDNPTARGATMSAANFQKSTTALAWSPAPPILKFERADWSLFRTIEGLQQKAGVPRHKLSRLVVKEITDNALDEGGRARVGTLPDGSFFIEDDGPGIDPAEIAHLFSIARPLHARNQHRNESRNCTQKE